MCNGFECIKDQIQEALTCANVAEAAGVSPVKWSKHVSYGGMGFRNLRNRGRLPVVYFTFAGSGLNETAVDQEEELIQFEVFFVTSRNQEEADSVSNKIMRQFVPSLKSMYPGDWEVAVEKPQSVPWGYETKMTLVVDVRNSLNTFNNGE